MLRITNYIDGRLIEPMSGNHLDNIEPGTGEVYSVLPDSDAADVELAVKAARNAFDGWSRLSAEERSRYLLKIVDIIDSKTEALAEAESRDNGKPVSLARSVDIPRASANFRFYATAAMHLANESHDTAGQAINYTLRQPAGIAGCISPWNLPLYLFTWKIAPALAAGCTVVAKPSEMTPMTAFMLSEIAIEAGLPAGALNIVHGTGPNVGGPIVKHSDIECISFTGGTATGEWIAREAAPMFKKLSLELGGKNPNIIFADCNYEDALSTTVRSSFSNQGQICLCGSRILVERPIYERFCRDLAERASTLKVGDPSDASTDIGAVISEGHMDKILGFIDSAKADGGRILSGGDRVRVEGRCGDGYFIAPTVIVGMSPSCRVNQEEIFGPVVTVMPFDSEEEALQIANSTRYGLSATVWTENLSRAHRMARDIKSGIVWINTWLLRDLRTPFGGMKNSGVGREGGFEALRFFTEEKNVCIKF
jgi:aminomuconate-semialdehyde/2-hydroxymuconate-6-semialdehyde dehydrogenase